MSFVQLLSFHNVIDVRVPSIALHDFFPKVVQTHSSELLWDTYVLHLVHITFYLKVGLLLILLCPLYVEARHWFFGHYWFEPQLGYVRKGTLICRDISSFYAIRDNANKQLNRWYLERELVKDGKCQKILAARKIKLTGYGNKVHSLLEFIESDKPQRFWWVKWIDVRLIN